MRAPGHEMGTLDFSALRVEILRRDAAFVRGFWHLTISDGKTPHGRSTQRSRSSAALSQPAKITFPNAGLSVPLCPLW